MDHHTAPIAQYSWASRNQSMAIVLLFSAALALPLVGCFFGWQGPSLSENRNLAERPDFRNTRLKDLQAKLDAYYRDHVGFRRAIIRLSRVMLHEVLKEPSGEVIIGRPPAAGQPPWYFYASEGIIEDRLGMGSLTPGELHSWKRMLESRGAWLQRCGIAYCLSLFPRKAPSIPNCCRNIFKVTSGRRDSINSRNI